MMSGLGQKILTRVVRETKDSASFLRRRTIFFINLAFGKREDASHKLLNQLNIR